jgi:sulfite exporter TauE/SafE
MCGPFVAFYSGADASGGARRLLSHAAYSGGRLLAYASLGVGAGSLGAALDLAGSLAGLQHVAAGIAGTVMVLWGLLALLQLRGVRIFHHTNGSRLAGFLRRGFLLVGEKPPVVRATAVGLLSGLLPCGWLWAFLVTGGAAAGALVMVAFWAGTVPSLVAVGLGAQLVSAPLRRHVPAATAALLVVLGIFAILSRPSSVTASLGSQLHSQQQVPATSEAGHACCAENRAIDRDSDGAARR